ncbi:DUF5689 domain-containing protein [Pedobacter sp.]|uniref:DUF5689 domain-containing protein n=1 Tax=Pedobacter sp. TaxID=1411316 RepID=UPI00396CAF4D
MKTKYLIIAVSLFISALFNACKKDINEAEGQVNPFAALFVVKKAYKGNDVQLSATNLAGATSTGGIVISDQTNGNIPKGTLVIQNTDRNITRGLIIDLGNVDVPFAPGDSVVLQLNGTSLVNVNGSIRLKGITLNNIQKIASGKTQKIQVVQTKNLLAAPLDYDGTLISVTNGIFSPMPSQGEMFKGDKKINDGFGDLIVHTADNASYANELMPNGINVVGLFFAEVNNAVANHKVWPRSFADITALKVYPPSPIVITGFLADPQGSDENQEYIQLMATKNIDFAQTPYAIITTNNAGSNIPIGAPVNGWATGQQRTYKFNLTQGTVSKGEVFYIGASNKLINGAGSTDISNAKWIRSIPYNVQEGDGFGSVSTNLLANSGNGCGIGVFKGINIDLNSVPLDVIFYGGNGSLFAAGPPIAGYKIIDNDYFDTLNPTTNASQPYVNQGTNTKKLPFPAASSFATLGGKYNLTTGRWSTGRVLKNVTLTVTSKLTDIEKASDLTTLEN